MTAFRRIVDALAAAGYAPRGYRSVKAHCPVPDHGKGRGDQRPSLSVWPDDKAGRARVKCWAGCDDRDVLAALDLGLRDLFDEPRTRTPYPTPRRARSPRCRHDRHPEACFDCLIGATP